MSGSSLALSPVTEQRILAAAEVLRVSPDTFLRRLLSQHYNTLGGLPLDLLRYVFTFLDYSTISGLVARVSRFWQDCVVESPQNVLSRLRQIHGIHLLDPVHGLFYFPRALKRVVFDAKGGGAGGAAGRLRSGADQRRAMSTTPAALHSNSQAVPASSFLTVDIRTQNTKTLPWSYVQMTVRRAIERERALFGAVRTPGLQRPEDPAWTQAATVTYDRHLYMFGGETYEGVVLDRAYEYDPMEKHWTVLPDLNEKRAAASAVAFRGRIFVFGGYNEEGEVLDTYEVLDVPTRSWASRHYPPSWLYTTSPHARTSTTAAATATTTSAPNTAASFRSISSVVAETSGAASGQYRMPEKICGTATTVYGDVIIFAGGHQSCIAPDQTAVSYSAMNSASTTPMHSVGGPFSGGGGGGGAGNRSVTGTSLSGLPGIVNAGDEASAQSAHGRDSIISHPTDSGIVRDDLLSVTASMPALAGVDSLTSPPTAGANNNNSIINSAAGGGGNTNTSAGARTNSPPGLPRVNSIAFDGPATAETLVWVFSPITGQWWMDAPRLPSPRAFGALTTLELPIVGSCLCYFGGCAKADAPETAMFYIPLGDAQATRLHDARPDDEDAGDGTDGPAHAALKESTNDDDDGGGQSCMTQSPDTASFLHAAQDRWRSSLRDAPPLPSPQQTTEKGDGKGEDAAAAADVANVPLITEPSRASAVDMITRCFRDLAELPWQRYVRVPIGGAFTSVAVIGHPHARTVVLTGFYPMANIGFCKVDSLLPTDALAPLLGALSPPPPPGAVQAENDGAATLQSPHTPPLEHADPSPTSLRDAPHRSPPPPRLDVSLQDEAAAAANHSQQEREWSHHQRQEVREMVRSAARAATLRHPRNPQRAGEERKWSLAPVPEVRVRNPTGPVLTRVSWKVQSLNAKVIVGIE
ncbi:hypothetical protein ABB37_05648 [Leptomonas pyrrhocoris]|uniref:F-box domain-containing protein n=1 Tax=Leptomonas pyrrhocoris TaxID=157538 RepID=A0A0M9FZ67_LEPPY|nr:hypothetical protein ABB37_05648 [Leptomonas pyrrhocoris]KPA79140.1 hypothetical protein ABB37_05648 [Leptomonas pyrrhocoris]|eukprot:XP_015657579.1 hypothetical protein ABB37_05648 [Leptomonas pyrrhocoris]